MINEYDASHIFQVPDGLLPAAFWANGCEVIKYIVPCGSTGKIRLANKAFCSVIFAQAGKGCIIFLVHNFSFMPAIADNGIICKGRWHEVQR